jgi:hypothetical protein
VNIETSFAPNVLLAKAGLMNDISKGDWKAQFHSAGGSAFLHLKDPNDAATLKAVEKLLAGLPVAQRRLFKIIPKNQLQEVGADPAAALALAAAPGTTISGSAKGELVKTAKGGTHGYYPDFREIQTGFIAYGAGIAKGGRIKEMQLIDVAPVIAELLSIDFKTAEGHIPAGILLP